MRHCIGSSRAQIERRACMPKVINTPASVPDRPAGTSAVRHAPRSASEMCANAWGPLRRGVRKSCVQEQRTIAPYRSSLTELIAHFRLQPVTRGSHRDRAAPGRGGSEIDSGSVQETSAQALSRLASKHGPSPFGQRAVENVACDSDQDCVDAPGEPAGNGEGARACGSAKLGQPGAP